MRFPDFTTYSDNKKTKVSAIFEVKDFNFTNAEIQALKRGEIVGGSYNPYNPIRNKISAAKKQFADCKKYPCILVLGRGGKHHPDPLMILAAMYGDLTISIPIDEKNDEVTEMLGNNGSMVNPSTSDSENTSITAIAIIGLICPDEKKSGYKAKLEELIAKYDISDKKQSDKWLRQADELRESLVKKGYKLNEFEAEVDFIINPESRKTFPVSIFSKGYTVLREYDMKTGLFTITKTW